MARAECSGCATFICGSLAFNKVPCCSKAPCRITSIGSDNDDYAPGVIADHDDDGFNRGFCHSGQWGEQRRAGDTDCQNRCFYFVDHCKLHLPFGVSFSWCPIAVWATNFCRCPMTLSIGKQDRVDQKIAAPAPLPSAVMACRSLLGSVGTGFCGKASCLQLARSDRDACPGSAGPS